MVSTGDADENSRPKEDIMTEGVLGLGFVEWIWEEL